MTEDTFPEHFDGTPVNPEGRVPEVLPLEFTNGKCSYRIDAEQVHILNKSGDDDEGMQWSEPMSAYLGIRRWVIAERAQEEVRPGFLARLFGRGPKPSPVDEGPRHAVIALAHQNEPWMSVVLFSRELADGEEDGGVSEIAEKYTRLFSF